MHALAGRKLNLRAIRGGKDIELHRADSEKLLRSRAASPGGFSILSACERVARVGKVMHTVAVASAT